MHDDSLGTASLTHPSTRPAALAGQRGDDHGHSDYRHRHPVPLRWLAGLPGRLWDEWEWLATRVTGIDRHGNITDPVARQWWDDHTRAITGDVDRPGGNGDAPPNEGAEGHGRSCADVPSDVRPGAHLLRTHNIANAETYNGAIHPRNDAHLRLDPDRPVPTDRPRHPLAPEGGYVKAETP